MDAAPVLIAVVVVAVVAGLVARRLDRAAKRGREERIAAPPVEDPTAGISTADQRFRLLSFQSGTVPADLGPLVEELRRNGIDVDEETLRRKLAEGVGGTRTRGAPATAIVVSIEDAPGEAAPPGTVAVEVTLEVEAPGRGKVRERIHATIAADKRALLEEGAAIPVRYDPDVPGSIALEWEIR